MKLLKEYCSETMKAESLSRFNIIAFKMNLKEHL